MELEYFAICETRTLKEVSNLEHDKKYVALVVAWVEGVRLIDKAPRKGAEGLSIAFLHPKSTEYVLTELCEK